MGETLDSDHVTWRQMLEQASEITGSRTMAKWLCEHASGCDGDEFDEILDELVNARSGLQLDDMLRRVAAGEPLQYVMGRWAFRHLDILVDRRVLIPRPETELLVDIVKKALVDRQRPLLVADLGTGSGAIGLSLLTELPLESAIVWMTDVSPDAIDVARANAAGLGRPAIGARFAVGSWFDALDPDLQGSFDAIVSNPPYIATDDPEVETSVRQWEPADALFSGTDGLDAMRNIVSNARRWLKSGGMLAVEIGHAQGETVNDLFDHAGFDDVAVHRDLAGRDRFVTGVSARRSAE